MRKDKFQDLQTPCLIVDRAKMLTNIHRMKNHLTSLGVSLRPHVKTTKSVEIIKLLFEGGTGPITVSTLREAEYFFEGGFTDIMYAVGIVPAKLGRVKKLIEAGAGIRLILDSLDVAQSLVDYGVTHQVIFDVLIEIDCDMHRAGLSPDDPQILDIAGLLEGSSASNFMGFMTHAGESYNCETTEAIRKHSHIERDAVVQAVKYTQQSGIYSRIVSAGSTPTARFADDLTGVTEVRAGVFVFQDLFQAGLGVCDIDDIALSVLTMVIGHKKNQNRLIIDAGGMALSKDRGTAHQKQDRLFGLVCSADDGKLIPNLIVEAANQEHGMITSLAGEINFDDFPIGTLLRILPNHACMTAAAHSCYHIIDGNQVVADIWPRCQGW
ncbi:MAG: alanine racemase [Alphaproteobacteria bacterium]|nr:MAG: alanine racemase [Alphaproteobacteria bacterium]